MSQEISQKNLVLASSLAAKANTKFEVLRFLAIECGYYLPKEHQITIYFLRDLIMGVSKGKFCGHFLHSILGIKSTDIHSIYVPQYESLTIRKVYEFL